MNTEEQLRSFIKKFDVEPKLNVIIKGRRAYHVPEEVHKKAQEIKMDVYSQGIPLGEAGQTTFQPSFYLLDQLATTEKYAVVNDEAEWMFVCARDVFENNVLEQGRTKSMFLVKNRRGEILGLGRWEKEGKNRFIKVLLDRGDFLRREEKRKKTKKPHKKKK